MIRISAIVTRALLYARTVRHLSARQIVARLRLRLRFAILARFGNRLEKKWMRGSRTNVAIGWPRTFSPLDVLRNRSTEQGTRILAGEVSLLNEIVVIADTDSHEHLSHLRRYHLYYLDWMWNIGAVADDALLLSTFRRTWTTLLSGTTFGAGDEWSPYVVSLRLWTLCGLHARAVESSDDRGFFAYQIARHYEFLVRHKENDVGGNHLIKNLKALVGVSVAFNDPHLTRVHVEEFFEELKRQVLKDGGHYELSHSYHAQVLGDAIDVASLLSTSGHQSDCASQLHGVIEEMRLWLANFVRPDGRVASFNDGFALDEVEVARLGVPRRTTHSTLLLLADSGYAVFRPESGVMVAMDVGRPCPPTLPAHSQADCLSVTLCIGSENVLVDTGTSEYGNGPRRVHERSTAAHSTVEIDGQNQTEVWGAFRAARRATARVIEMSNDGISATLTAEHDGYARLRGRPIHRRTVGVAAGSMQIDDHIRGRGKHRSVSRLMVGTTSVERVTDTTFKVNGDVTIECLTGSVEAESMVWSEEFGRLVPGTCLLSDGNGSLPRSMRWKVTWTA